MAKGYLLIKLTFFFRRNSVQVQHLRQILHIPAILPQAHALPHRREALLLLPVRQGLQGTVDPAESRADSQRGEAIRVRDMRKELPPTGILPCSQVCQS